MYGLDSRLSYCYFISAQGLSNQDINRLEGARVSIVKVGFQNKSRICIDFFFIKFVLGNNYIGVSQI